MSAKDIERLGEALYLAERRSRPNYRRTSTWLYEKRVRAILQALRNPSEELCDVGVKYMPGPSWSSDVGRAFTAMIDHLLDQ